MSQDMFDGMAKEIAILITRAEGVYNAAYLANPHYEFTEFDSEDGYDKVQAMADLVSDFAKVEAASRRLRLLLTAAALP
jgi:hypothetical protein